MYPKACEYLRPVHTFSKFCGTYPGTMTSPKSWYYNLTYGVLVAVPLFRFAREMLPKVIAIYTDIVCFTALLSFIMKICACVCLVFVPICRQKCYFKLFKSISEAELLIFSLNMNQRPTPTRRWQWFYCFASVLLLFSHTIVWYEIFNTSFYVALGSFLLHMPLCAMFLHFISLLTVIEDKFSLLNWHIEYLNNKVPSYLLPPDDSLFLQNKIHGRHCADKFVDFALSKRDVTIDKIKTFNKIHFLLHSASSLVNEYFSLQNLTCSLQLGLGIVNIAVFTCDARNSRLHPGFMIFFSLPMVYVVSLFFNIAKRCQEIKIVSKATGVLVHYLIQEDHPPVVLDELEAFSKQLAIRHINFSASGFFDVDLKTITSMVCILVPVSVFLVQYNNRALDQHIKLALLGSD